MLTVCTGASVDMKIIFVFQFCYKYVKLKHLLIVIPINSLSSKCCKRKIVFNINTTKTVKVLVFIDLSGFICIIFFLHSI